MKKDNIIVFTHRGLEPSNSCFYPESSYEAYKDHISRGFGIEFDPNFCKDGLVVSHDSTLKRITNGADSRNFSDLYIVDVNEFKYGNEKRGRIASLSEILELISNGVGKMHAMHVKGIHQTKEKVDALMNEIKKHPAAIGKILIFDLKPEWARYIKGIIPEIKLANSVAHAYDIERYNAVVAGTLLSVQEAIVCKKEGMYDWAWLDEWDTKDKNGKEKRFYTQETFKTLRQEGYKIALVTPELHGTSPGLLGGEAHADAHDKERLFERIKEILALNPDAVCTDYPQEVSKMMSDIQ